MWKKLFGALLVILLLHKVKTQSLTDMGDCACVCGLNSEGNIEGGIATDGSLLTQIRGPKGDIGRPGKPGPSGSLGTPGLRGPPGPQGISEGKKDSNFAESCFAYKEDGNMQSGIYTIKPSSSSASVDVYCDMITAGGGWTLVASVHENNIKGKCTFGDNWSSDQGQTNPNYNGTKNWENFNVFGNVESATSDDYKSPAYFNVMSTDVMIWHVPNDVEISDWQSQAFLKYYTRNGFLSDYGGTLQSVYSKYYPLQDTQNSGNAYQGITSVLEALNATAPAIRGEVTNFYKYTYDYSGTQNYIGDGGRDMFDSGNRVYYKIGAGLFQLITYRETYKDENNEVEVSSSTGHPFIALMWVGNRLRRQNSFALKVGSGTGADGSGSSQYLQGEISYQSFDIKYKVKNIYAAGDPSISEVFFCISNRQRWTSVPPSSFIVADSSQWTSRTDNIINIVTANGSPSNILMGYTLLSRSDASAVPESEIRSALTRITDTISGFPSSLGQNCSREEDSLVVPVSYVDGSNDNAILSHVPPDLRNDVTPGFVQFRSLSSSGVPNALCPGYKTSSCTPSKVCIGGVNSAAYGDDAACGDFAAWDGDITDSPTDTTPAGTAHSLNDIKSSILIFTRAGTTSKRQQL